MRAKLINNISNENPTLALHNYNVVPVCFVYLHVVHSIDKFLYHYSFHWYEICLQCAIFIWRNFQNATTVKTIIYFGSFFFLSEYENFNTKVHKYKKKKNCHMLKEFFVVAAFCHFCFVQIINILLKFCFKKRCFRCKQIKKIKGIF